MKDTWTVEQTSFTGSSIEKFESLFSLGNGNLGFRGNMEEEEAIYQRGTYLNGFYDTFPLCYGERAFGYPEEGQRLLDLPEGKIFTIRVNGEPLETAKVLQHRRVLDMKHGVVKRTFFWKTCSGIVIDISMIRLVSFVLPSVAMQIFEFTVHGKVASFEIISSLDMHKGEERYEHTGDPREGSSVERGTLVKRRRVQMNTGFLSGYETQNSGLFLAAGMDHFFPDRKYDILRFIQGDDGDSLSFCFRELSGKLTFIKYLSYRQGTLKDEDRCFSLCSDDLSFCRNKGPEYFRKEQTAYLKSFWEKSDISIEGNDELQKAVRLDLYHLLQSAGKDGKTSIAAKGLSGRGYDGHYFWDSEVYIVPFFIYTAPDIARALLFYRYSILDHARSRAEELSHKGALFPWRTINGKEASAYFPAGTAQYHINADIAYSINMYLDVTGDISFLVDAGFEIFVETARFWVDLGFFIPGKNGAFCIHEVTGPDEYSALANNNYYTNIMAKDNLETAVKWYDWLKESDFPSFHELVSRLGIDENERYDWERAAEKMYLPFNEDYGIIPQDDAFLDRPVWDFEGTPRDRYPLLLYYHPLTIYRFQVLKQADVVMALFLKNNEFTFDDKKRTFDYYEKITTGDSSLSAAIQGILALELGYEEKGYQYFLKTVYMDYHNVNGNVRDGIHTASMGGAWMMIVYGFAGMRERNGSLSFLPHLPGMIRQLSFRIMYKTRLIEVVLSREKSSYLLLDGEKLSFTAGGVSVLLLPGERKEIHFNGKCWR